MNPASIRNHHERPIEAAISMALQTWSIRVPLLRRFLFTSLCCIAFASVALAGDERSFPNVNVAVTPPDGWVDVTSTMTVKGMVAAYRDSTQSRVVMLLSEDNPNMVSEINAQWVDSFEKTMTNGGGSKRIAGDYVTFLGIKCYERTGTRSKGDKSLATVARAVPVYGRVYLIQGLSLHAGTAMEDSDIRQFVESFHFLNTPRLVPVGR